MTPLVILFSVLFCLLGLVIYGTVAKNRWGINMYPLKCPRCDAPLSEVRVPKSLRQALWGGTTCMSCGTEVDKWGRKIEPGLNARSLG